MEDNPKFINRLAVNKIIPYSPWSQVGKMYWITAHWIRILGVANLKDVFLVG
jgi:hypothetical protein